VSGLRLSAILDTYPLLLSIRLQVASARQPTCAYYMLCDQFGEYLNVWPMIRWTASIVSLHHYKALFFSYYT